MGTAGNRRRCHPPLCICVCLMRSVYTPLTSGYPANGKLDVESSSRTLTLLTLERLPPGDPFQMPS